jgi:ABC-type transport system involved in cytochrome bd biosynthesis fused ATPase/permease subunit
MQTDRKDSSYVETAGWYWATGIAICVIARSICDRRGRYNNFVTSFIINSSLRGLMFDKINKMRPGLRPHLGTGNCTNLVINDVEQLGRGSIFWH